MLYAEYPRDGESVSCFCRPQTASEWIGLVWHSMVRRDKCRRFKDGTWQIGLSAAWFDANVTRGDTTEY